MILLSELECSNIINCFLFDYTYDTDNINYLDNRVMWHDYRIETYCIFYFSKRTKLYFKMCSLYNYCKMVAKWG